jgi:hypothetical protein
MESYTHGSAEGLEALKRALLDGRGEGHVFTMGLTDCTDMANALETAAIAGYHFAEKYTGISWGEAALWPHALAAMDLDNVQVIELVDALHAADQLGDDFAGGWLSGLAECVDVEWI